MKYWNYLYIYIYLQKQYTMELNSQICTTKEQSKRLLALGLKKETADMGLAGDIPIAIEDWETQDTILIDSPAWSLHRLMCLCPTNINRYDFYVSHDYVHYHDMITDYGDDELVGFFKDNPFDSLIDCIEWLIKEGHFNKEYIK